MKFPEQEKAPPPGHRVGFSFARIWARLAAAYLDEELAEGVSPSTNLRLTARARQITQPRALQSLARALRSTVSSVGRPRGPFDPRVPMDERTILACRDEIAGLADRLATTEHPRARGVAIARQLAFDGLSPMFWKPMGNGDGPARLSSAIHTANAALDVAADFD